MNVADHYTYRVRWSAEDGEYVGTVAELPSLSWLASDRAEAFIGIQRLAAEVVAEMAAAGAGSRDPAHRLRASSGKAKGLLTKSGALRIW